MLLALLFLLSVAEARCPDVPDCQARASAWEDGAWFGVGIGWAGLGTAVTLEALPAADISNFGAVGSLTGFGLSVPLMAAAARPSHHAVTLSENELTLELRRRPRYWAMYAAGMAAGGAAVGLVLTDTGPWWVAGGLGLGAAGVLTGSAAGFARDSRWVRRQAPTANGRPRHPVRVRFVPTGSGGMLLGRF